MASYDVNNDIVGGGGFGGFGGFGGGCGLLVVLLILFAVFSGGGLFGRHDGHREHDRDFDELRSRFTSPCCCVSNCQIDKDVVTSRDAVILDNHKILEQNLERKIIERDMIIQEQKNQLFLNAQFAELTENLNARFNCIEREIEKRPAAVPHFAKTVDACVQPQLNCFERGREFFDGRRDRDRDDCCFC